MRGDATPSVTQDPETNFNARVYRLTKVQTIKSTIPGTERGEAKC